MHSGPACSKRAPGVDADCGELDSSEQLEDCRMGSPHTQGRMSSNTRCRRPFGILAILSLLNEKQEKTGGCRKFRVPTNRAHRVPALFLHKCHKLGFFHGVAKPIPWKFGLLTQNGPEVVVGDKFPS